MRIAYRARQLWHALTATPQAEDLEQARQALAPELMELFLQMQASEQAHSLQIYRQLREQGETDPDLLRAALLHDVGKSRYPLNAWERTEIVLGKALFPGSVQRWGQAAPVGWRRPFVVAEQHADWGAEMAAEAGAPLMTVALIRRHQTPVREPARKMEDRLLYQLQLFDNES